MDYTEDNKQYQKVLDKVYQGKVKPLERYINPRATLIHYCTECESQFYAKPMWLVGKDSQRHDCLERYGGINEVSSPKQKRVTKDMKKEMVRLAKQGFNVTQIAKTMGVNRSNVHYHLKKARKG